jgi:hypothetical protein
MNIMKKKLIILMVSLMLIPGIEPVVAQTYTGYTLYSKMGNNKAYLISMSNAIYHTWTCSGQTGYSSYLLENGVLLRTVQYSGNILNGPAMCGMVQKVDWNGNLLWQYIYSTSSYCSHHDIHAMPNGNVLMIVYEVKSATEVTAAGCSQNIVMWPDKIIEVQPSGTNGGTIVWEWHAWDHLCQNYNSSKNNYVTSVAAHPELLNINYNTQKDWMHTNGIDYNPQLDQIVISSHYLNEIYVIDHSTTTAQAATHTGGNSGKGGDILYRWGNPAAYGLGTASNQVFKVVHDAHWVPDGYPKGNDLVGFNNKGINNNQSCVDIIAPPYSGSTYTWTPGSAYTPSTYTWRHACLSSAQDQSSSQQFPNGNMLICIASTGYMYEIDSMQNLLWSFTAGGTVAKAYRYTECYVNGGLSVTATATPSSGCAGTSVQLNTTVSGGSSYTYLWTSIPAGFTSTTQNPVVTPAVTTSYIVNVASGTCTNADTVTVTVTPQPTVLATATPNQVCPAGNVQLNAVPSGTNTYSFLWSSVPAGFTSTLQNPVATPSVATTYHVTITSGTCMAADSVMVDMLTQPTVTAAASPSEICPNASCQLTATPGTTTSFSYSWTSVPAGFTSSNQNPVVTPLISTIYIVNIFNNGCQASDSVQVIVDALPATPVITKSGDSLVSGSSTGNQWFLDGNPISGATGQYLVITAPGTYQVQVTGPTGCLSALSDPYVYVGLGENLVAGSVKIYPNPSTGIMRIMAPDLGSRSFEVRIFNAMGRMVLCMKNTFTFDLSGMDAGFYYLTILTTRSECINKKIILIKS